MVKEFDDDYTKHFEDLLNKGHIKVDKHGQIRYTKGKSWYIDDDNRLKRYNYEVPGTQQVHADLAFHNKLYKTLHNKAPDDKYLDIRSPHYKEMD